MRVAWVVAIMWSGCGGDQEKPPPVVEPYARAASYCERSVDFYCAFYLRCDWMAVTTVADCHERFLEVCNQRYEPIYVAMEAAGLLRLSNPGLAECGSHLEAVPCSEQASDLQGPCASMWEGQQSVGASCGMGSAGIENMVCGASSRCILDMSFCGTCELTVGVGGTCAVDSDCEVNAACVGEVCVGRAAIGTVCDADHPCVSGARCQEDSCVARHPKGGLGDPCVSVLDCQYATSCVARECVAAVRLGEACDATTPCDSGYCDGTCQQMRGPGAPCQGDIECLSGGCVAGACAPIPGSCIQP